MIVDMMRNDLGKIARPGSVQVSALFEAETYPTVRQLVSEVRAKQRSTPSHGLDLDALEAGARAPSHQGVLVHDPVPEPDGRQHGRGPQAALVALLARHGVPLIEDDVYGELYFGNRCPLPAKAFDTEGLVMHCSSFSKTLAPGFRIGWVAPGATARPSAI